MDDIADRLVGATVSRGDLGRLLSSSRGEQDLSAEQGESVFRTQSIIEHAAFGSVQGMDEDWLSHASFYQPSIIIQSISPELALARSACAGCESIMRHYS